MAARLIGELVSSVAAQTPDRWAVASPDGAAITFAEFDRRIRSVAQWVSARTRPGDRVAVVADNSTDYAVLYYAVPASRRVLALINQRLHAREQAAVLNRTQADVVIGDAPYLAALPPSPVQRIAFDCTQWDAAMSGDPAPTQTARPDDAAWLLFTSGSTGEPKAVVHTHRSVTAAVWGTVAGRAVRGGGSYLLPFPMCHIAGYNMLVHHAVGSTVVPVARFRAAEFAETVRGLGVTSCSLAPTMLAALLDHLEETGGTLPSLRTIAYGSAAMPAGLIRRAIDVLGADFHQGYGMTETGGNITFLGPDDHRSGDPAVLASAGFAHAGVELRVFDETGGERSTGEAGEIVVRGEQVAVDGWLHTGDVGRLDAHGRLTVLDRIKDVIITGGENVSSREVEDVLSRHPGVRAAAVVGVPDAYWGEAVCAVVVASPDRRPTTDELTDRVRRELAAFKRPRHVLFVDSLPLTTNGKVAKDAVRRYARESVLGQR